ADGRGWKPIVPELGDRGVPVALRELLPVRPEYQAVMDDHGQLAAEGARDPLLELEVRTMVAPPDHVRYAQRQVVDDRCELIRGGPVGPEQRRAVAAEAHRAVGVALDRPRPERLLDRLAVELPSLALPHRPLVEADAEPGEIVEDRLLSTLDCPGRIRVVDAQHERPVVLVREVPVRDSRQGVTEMERARRARREADSGRHATNLRRGEEPAHE